VTIPKLGVLFDQKLTITEHTHDTEYMMLDLSRCLHHDNSNGFTSTLTLKNAFQISIKIHCPL